MKKNIITLTFALLLLGGQTVSASTGEVTASSLRVRSKSSLSSSTLGYLYKNNKINTLSKEGDFYKINYQGKNGYVHSSYIKILSSGSTQPVQTNTSTAKVGQTTASLLNVRSGASSTHGIIGSLTKGTKVDLYEKVNGFYKISYKGKTGFISAEYVSIVNTPSSGVSIKPVNNSVSTLDPSSGEITASSLNVRSGASSSFGVIGGLAKGTKVSLNGKINGFYKINYKGITGYISADYVKILEGTTLGTNAAVSRGTTGQYIDNIITYAKSFLGTPYAFGGGAPARYDNSGKYLGGGFDCSGYIQYVFKNFGVTLPRTTYEQVNKGISVNVGSLQKGDLLFFTTNSDKPSDISHVGIYIGNNQFIHSPNTGDVVKISEFAGYYKDKFILAKRVVN